MKRVHRVPKSRTTEGTSGCGKMDDLKLDCYGDRDRYVGLRLGKKHSFGCGGIFEEVREGNGQCENVTSDFRLERW